ncbi:MAG: hypothetical protein E7001_08605 [Coriobacteriaceae bacterium]|nr:hypothetical protein [Coriobacteriaceae bacterium]
MSPSTIGGIAAGFIVAVSSGLAVRFRRPRQAGEVQTYSRVTQAIILVVGILALTAAIAVFATTPVKDLKDWFGIIGTFLIGIASLVVFFYYLRCSVVVTPDSITVNDPFKGTATITRDNLVSITETAFKGAAQTKFVFNDNGRRRTLTLAHAKFDLTSFIKHGSQ